MRLSLANVAKMRRKKFHPKSLFAPLKWPKNIAPYATDDEVLDAVRDGEKAMFFTGLPFSCVADGDGHFGDLLEAAFDRGLAVILDNRTQLPKGRWEPAIYVLHLDQAWRVPALNALNETAFIADGRWSLSAEAQRSLLLGYTANQRKRWLAWQRQRKAAETSLDLYTLLTAAHLKNAKNLGMRCFGTNEQMVGMSFFFPRGENSAPKDNAARLVPKGFTFARVGLSWKAAQELFGTFKTWKSNWMTVQISEEQAHVISAGLKSNVQVLTARGWR
jgi:hypothetical protein